MIMLFFKTMKIRHKLTIVIMLTCIVSLVLVGTIFIMWGYTSSRKSMTHNLLTQAEMIADNCKASVTFDDPKDAGDILSTLHLEPSIIHACIHTNDGKDFASYYREDVDSSVHPTEILEDGFKFNEGLLSVFKSIVVDDETVASVCLLSDLKPLYVALTRNIYMVVSVLSCVSLVAYLLSLKLQGIISGPILSLAESAARIGKGELNHRVKIQSKDELGTLAQSFNDMAGKLKELYEDLEGKVRQRTSELSLANMQLEEESTERLHNQKMLEERIKEVSCLFKVSKLIEQPKISLERIFQETVHLIRKAYHYPDVTCVRITFDGIHYKTDNFRKSELSQYADIKLQGEKAGGIEVYYLGKKAENGKSPFLKEERDLLDAVVEHLGRTAERKKAAKTLQLFRNLIDQSNDCIFVIEPKWGRFLDANDRACNSLGYARKELLEMTFKDIEETIQDESSWQQHIEKLKLKRDFIIQGRHKRKDGTTFFAETSLKLVSQGEQDYIIAIARDITERKEAEEALEASNRELKDFAYIASHDLREPLRKINSFGELLKDSLGGNLGKDDQENLEFMIDGACRMEEMVAAILKYSRVGTKELSFEAVDLNEIVEQLEQLELAELLEETSGTIEVQQPLPKVEADSPEIRQLLQNLIANGIKYRREEVRPRIVIRAKQIDNDKVRIEVQDNGIGIKQEYYNDIFTMFKRLHSKQKYKGTGIGLAVCKKIVERHNGQIGVESKYGEGSMFWFTLSAAKEAVAVS